MPSIVIGGEQVSPFYFQAAMRIREQQQQEAEMQARMQQQKLMLQAAAKRQQYEQQQAQQAPPGYDPFAYAKQLGAQMAAQNQQARQNFVQDRQFAEGQRQFNETNAVNRQRWEAEQARDDAQDRWNRDKYEETTARQGRLDKAAQDKESAAQAEKQRDNERMALSMSVQEIDRQIQAQVMRGGAQAGAIQPLIMRRHQLNARMQELAGMQQPEGEAYDPSAETDSLVKEGERQRLRQDEEDLVRREKLDEAKKRAENAKFEEAKKALPAKFYNAPPEEARQIAEEAGRHLGLNDAQIESLISGNGSVQFTKEFERSLEGLSPREQRDEVQRQLDALTDTNLAPDGKTPNNVIAKKAILQAGSRVDVVERTLRKKLAELGKNPETSKPTMKERIANLSDEKKEKQITEDDKELAERYKEALQQAFKGELPNGTQWLGNAISGAGRAFADLMLPGQQGSVGLANEKRRAAAERQLVAKLGGDREAMNKVIQARDAYMRIYAPSHAPGGYLE